MTSSTTKGKTRHACMGLSLPTIVTLQDEAPLRRAQLPTLLSACPAAPAQQACWNRSLLYQGPPETRIPPSALGHHASACCRCCRHHALIRAAAAAPPPAVSKARPGPRCRSTCRGCLSLLNPGIRGIAPPGPLAAPPTAACPPAKQRPLELAVRLHR